MKYLLLILVLVIYYKSQKENMTTSSRPRGRAPRAPGRRCPEEKQYQWQQQQQQREKRARVRSPPGGWKPRQPRRTQSGPRGTVSRGSRWCGQSNVAASSDSLFSNICTFVLILLIVLLYIGFQHGQPLTLKKEVVN
jgi:hypothetical protein